VSSPAYRLVALDIDGTLLDSRKRISPRTQEALRAARRAGVHLVLVTGRRYPAARKVADELGGGLLLILHNGALIIENGAVLRCRPLDRGVARRAIRIGREQGADPVVHCGQRGEGRLWVERVAPTNPLLGYYLDRAHPDVVSVRDLVEELEEDPIQVMFGGAMAEMDALLPRLVSELGGAVRVERTVYPEPGVGILDVLDPGAGKAGALGYLRERWGLARRETLAIGDNWNDREMLEQAGLGLVMGNAEPEMRGLGLPVLPSNDEDGVAVAVERYVLGPA
jgi:Cof subfamily protein (haloacid dehalogenase superfamily)